MTITQSQYSSSKLIFKALTKKKVSLDNFSPFAIKIDHTYCSDKTLEPFASVFTNVDKIPTFAFVASFKTLLQCVVQAPIPSSLMGLIHLVCEVKTHAAHNWYLPYDIEVTLEEYEKSEKGISYFLKTDFYQMGKKTITNRNVMLDKARGYKSKAGETPTKNELITLSEPLASWATSLKTTWSYAKLSGDYNPIHLSPFLAKKLGFKNVIVHGMYNVHATLKEIAKCGEIDTSFVKIEFNKPCFMPNQVFLRQYQDTDSYGLFSGDKKDRYLKLTLS